jgi:hypothetical protein
MPTIKVLGKVLPSVIQISLDSIPEVDWTAAEAKLQMHFHISIVKSLVEVTIDLNKYPIDDLAVVFNRVFDLTRACVDTLVFATGYGLTVYLDQLVAPDGTVSPILLQNPALAAHCTFFKFPIVTQKDRLDFEIALKTVFSEPAVFMALNELTQAIMLPHQGITNCARVLDGLRKLVVPGVDSKNAWPIFQATFNADQAYLGLIFTHAKNTRHGDRTFISGPITTEIVNRTWIIMNRFLEYRKRGNQNLPLTDFPLLQG